MKAYKLTDKNNETKNNTLWGENVTNKAIGPQTQSLCSDGWIHFYTHPLIAILMNPVHTNFSNPILWEGEANGSFLHEPLKSGCVSFTTIKQIPISSITTTQKVAFAVLCALEMHKEEKFVKWAENWLSNKDRSYEAADAAANAAAYAAYAASAACVAAAYAAYAASDAARACADAAARACAYAASAAARADANKNINFISLVEKALIY